MGLVDGALLWIHGRFLGRIRLHHEHDSAACLRPDLYGTLQLEAVRQLHYMVCSWYLGQHANSLRRVLANPN